MRVVSCIATLHDPWLVLLAAVVCVAGGWVALELFRRAQARAGVQRSGWVFLAAIAAGSSVWCTHFISMLAYESGAPVTYDAFLTMLSLVVVIAGSAVGFALALKPGPAFVLGGGTVVGLSIASMHYTGMMAYHVDGLITWDGAYVAASVANAVLFGALALLASRAGHRLVSLALFTVTVVGLHFTGMTAVSVTPFVTGAAIADPAVVSAMALAVAGVAMIIVATGVASYLIDTDATERNLDSLRHMALNDTLTGLPNRASFNDYLASELQRAAADRRRLAVLGIDLDKFKEINDVRGHEAGDQALRIIAARMAGMLRDGEYVARIGGDEFAAVKRYLDQRDLMDFVSRLEAQLFAPMRIDDVDVVPGASIGVSVFPDDGKSAARLVGNADLAMYRAKAELGRAVCFYEVEMDERARARRDLALDLRQAIERDELALYYQIQTDVTGARTTGYEVLLRWNHARLGPVPPAEFIPLAEETGTILAIGEWVLREACRQAASWDTQDRIAVNLSAVQLTHCDLPALVREVLVETGLKASRLELEITETSIIQDKVRSLHALRQIRALGVTIAIDDFGTGYSSLDTLRSFPFDRIKLDRSFMREVEESVQARAIIRAVLALGKSLNISVLAEGVETREQLMLLELEGCDEAQGFYLGRPAPRDHAGAAKPAGIAAA